MSKIKCIVLCVHAFYSSFYTFMDREYLINNKLRFLKKSFRSPVYCEPGEGVSSRNLGAPGTRRTLE